VISFRLASKMLAMPVFKCTALVLILQVAGFVPETQVRKLGNIDNLFPRYDCTNFRLFTIS